MREIRAMDKGRAVLVDAIGGDNASFQENGKRI